MKKTSPAHHRLSPHSTIFTKQEPYKQRREKRGEGSCYCQLYTIPSDLLLPCLLLTLFSLRTVPMLYPTVDQSGTRLLRANSSSSVPRGHRRHAHRRTYPPALPCKDYYVHFPEEAGPTGNVEICSLAELQEWLLVARPVSAEEAERRGGCIKFIPLRSGSTPLSSAVQPLYFCITDPDDVVYGRAHYIPLCSPTEKVTAGECVEWTEEDALTRGGTTPGRCVRESQRRG